MAMFNSVCVSGFDLVKDGSPKVVVYLTKEEITSYQAKDIVSLYSTPWARQQAIILQMALDDLVVYMKKMSGATLEIKVVSNISECKTPAIIIGKLANELGAMPQNDSILHEAYRIIVKKDCLLIGANGASGAAYGIYEVLEKLGCDWVMPGDEGEEYPSKQTLTLPVMDISALPSFSMRSPWYSGGAGVILENEAVDFNRWKIRKKLQFAGFEHPLWLQGGHMWDALIAKNKDVYEKNPELLALVKMPDGTYTRKGPQIETTNPKNVEIAAQYIRDYFKRNNWSKDKAIRISVGPADGTWFSESRESIIAGGGRIDPISGEIDASDLVLKFANDIAELLGNEYPNLRLGYYIYSIHADYPKLYKPLKGKLSLQVADISYSRLHSMHDPASKSRRYFSGIMDAWAKIARETDTEMSFYVYNWNLADNFLPSCKLKMVGDDLAWYAKNNFIGHRSEWVKAWSVSGAQDYLMAEMSWNANLDWKQILKKYCVNSYGVEASPYIIDYYLDLVERQNQAGQEAGSYYAFNLFWDDNSIMAAEQKFNRALSVDGLTERQRKRIEYAKFPLDMLKRYFAFRKSYYNLDFISAEAQYNDMIDSLNKQVKVNPFTACRVAPKYLQIFLKKFVESGKQYSTGENQVIHAIPDRLITMLDSTNAGKSMGYYVPDISDKHCFTTATYTSTADAQGLSGFRGGSIWYRHHFNIPENFNEKKIGLFIGGADSIVHVWLNGEYIGKGEGFSMPFIFDITPNMNFGNKDNLLAIQVQHPITSELGTAGLIYPSFIFVTKDTVKNNNNKRKEVFLPGGAIQ